MANPRHLPKSLTPTELETLISRSRPDVAALVEFLSETGLRLTEACSITSEEARTWQNPGIIFRDHSAGLFRRLHRQRPAFTSVVGKGSKERLIVLSGAAVRASGVLLDHPAERIRKDMLLPWGPRRVEELVSEAGKAVGLKVWPHALRHTFAQSHANAGTPIDVIADMMGHSSLSTTRIYEEASRTRRIQALKRRKRWARRAR